MAGRRIAMAASAAAAILCLLSSDPAWSVGSVAIGLPSDVAEGGIAIGVAYNYGAQGDADAEALKQCLSYMDAPDSTRALCKVTLKFTNQCFAVAMDPEPGTYGIGYRVAHSQAEADTRAMDDCLQSSYADRKEFCKVTYRICDGTAS